MGFHTDSDAPPFRGPLEIALIKPTKHQALGTESLPMSLPKVYITRPLPSPVVERLAARCEVRMRPEDAPLDAAQLAESCREIEGLMATGVRVSEDVIAQATRLRVVANVGVGYDNIDVTA